MVGGSLTGRPSGAVALVREQLRLLMAGRRWSAALELIDRASLQAPHEPGWLISRAQCLLALRRAPDARRSAAAALSVAPDDPVMLDAIGSLLSQGNDQSAAYQAYDRAVKLAPGKAHFLFNRATVARFLGRLSEAERDYDEVLRLKPNDWEAYKNRAELRVQSAAANHVEQLERALLAVGDDWRGEVQLRYALAKEYEDLERFDPAFAHLSAGAQLRRRHLRYDIATDEATVDWIIEAFPGSARVQAAAMPSSEAPIFIVGLPRSGTTLVDRILSSHSEVSGAGELDQFAVSLVDLTNRLGEPTGLRRELVMRSAGVDFAALGRHYLAGVRGSTGIAARFTDKMPLNYLYCGLIHRALPGAKIVHLTRHPMAAGYAMYKTLFKDAYPFSYDLHEIGRYYAAYRRLMAHWQQSLPGVIHEVSYESLVDDQLGETRKLLAFCGLAWQERCLDFHRNTAASTTASAVQVRRPLYRTSLAQWQHYTAQLEPLAQTLHAAGVATDRT